MRKLRGAKAVQLAREDAYARALSENGDHVCVPWLGVDMDGRYVCPGFEYKPNRGLLAYVVPLVLQREVGLVPGFAGTPKLTLPPRASVDPSAPVSGPQPAGELPADTMNSDYFLLLRRFLRIVKITGMETERKFVPYPDDYYVVVSGPYERSLVGHLVTRPDGTGSRFFVPDGVDPKTVQQKVDTSRINSPSPSAGTKRDSAIETLPAPAPGTGGAALKALAADFRSQRTLYGSTGLPRTGRSYDRQIETEDLTVVSPGYAPAYPSAQTLRGIQSQDPAKILGDLA